MKDETKRIGSIREHFRKAALKGDHYVTSDLRQALELLTDALQNTDHRLKEVEHKQQGHADAIHQLDKLDTDPLEDFDAEPAPTEVSVPGSNKKMPHETLKDLLDAVGTLVKAHNARLTTTEMRHHLDEVKRAYDSHAAWGEAPQYQPIKQKPKRGRPTKLTPEERDEARVAYRDTSHTIGTLAVRWGVSESTMGKILETSAGVPQKGRVTDEECNCTLGNQEYGENHFYTEGVCEK